MKAITVEELITRHLTEFLLNEGGDITPGRISSAYDKVIGNTKISLNKEEIITEVARRWTYNTYEYTLTNSHLQDVPKGLFQYFEQRRVHNEDLERLRDILFEAGLKEESMLVSDKIAEL